MTETTSTTAVPNVQLNNGVRDPAARLRGLPDPAGGDQGGDRDRAQVGYRHIDTAEMYGNEKGVGEGGPRVRHRPLDEIFVTSKLNNGSHAYDDALPAFDQTLKTFDWTRSTCS